MIQLKKLYDYLQELLKQKTRSQDIGIDNTLEKVQDKVLDIMRPLPKLWVLIEQVNSDIGSSSTVEMDTVLEPLEKMVLLIGNVIMQLHMKEGKMFYWVSQGPLHHKSLQCLKKREHSYKNTIRCFLEYFRDHLTKSLKATKQSIEAIAEDGLLREPT